MTKSLRDLLEGVEDDDLLREIKAELSLTALAADLLRVADECGYSRREIAARMGQKSASTVQRIVQPAGAWNPTIETIVRFLLACGYELQHDVVKSASKDFRRSAWVQSPKRRLRRGAAFQWSDEGPCCAAVAAFVTQTGDAAASKGREGAISAHQVVRHGEEQAEEEEGSAGH